MPNEEPVDIKKVIEQILPQAPEGATIPPEFISPQHQIIELLESTDAIAQSNKASRGQKEGGVGFQKVVCIIEQPELLTNPWDIDSFYKTVRRCLTKRASRELTNVTWIATSQYRPIDLSNLLNSSPYSEGQDIFIGPTENYYTLLEEAEATQVTQEKPTPSEQQPAPAQPKEKLSILQRIKNSFSARKERNRDKTETRNPQLPDTEHLPKTKELSKYRPKHKMYKNPDIIQSLNGQTHIERVLILQEHLTELYVARHPDQVIDREALRIASQIHDVRREKSITAESDHGLNAAKWFEENPKLFPKITPETRERVKFICEWHDRPDYEVPTDSPDLSIHRELFTNADRLDHVRVGDFDEKFLTVEEAKELIPAAQLLYTESKNQDVFKTAKRIGILN